VSAHARLGPSAAKRWMRCPGSVREAAKYPDTAGAAAIDGTHSHTLLEHCLKHDLVDPMLLIGHPMADHEGSFEVDGERAARVQHALAYIKRRKGEAGPQMSIRAEEKVNPGEYIRRDDVWGTADVQLIFNDVLEVIDYKDGMTPVDAVESEQLRCYGVGALLPYIAGDGIPFKTVRLTIIRACDNRSDGTGAVSPGGAGGCQRPDRPPAASGGRGRTPDQAVPQDRG